MSLLWADGFEDLPIHTVFDSASAIKYIIDLQWDNIPILNRGRFGGKCAGFINTWQWAICPVVVTNPIVGFAFQTPRGNSGAYSGPVYYNSSVWCDLVWFQTMDYAHFYGTGLYLTPTLQIQLTGIDDQGNASSLAVSEKPLKAGVYQYIEIDTTGGAVKVYVEGEEWINEMRTVGECRFVFGPGIHHLVWFRSALPDYHLYDDLYICDSAGSRCNSRLGDIRIQTKFPESDGYYTQWNTTGANHYGEINEAYDQLSIATKVAAEVEGKKDTYNVSGFVDAEVEVPAVALGWYVGAQRENREIAGLARLSGTDAETAAVEIAKPLGFAEAFLEADPADDDWTVSNVNAAEFGQKLAEMG